MCTAITLSFLSFVWHFNEACLTFVHNLQITTPQTTTICVWKSMYHARITATYCVINKWKKNWSKFQAKFVKCAGPQRDYCYRFFFCTELSCVSQTINIEHKCKVTRIQIHQRETIVFRNWNKNRWTILLKMKKKKKRRQIFLWIKRIVWIGF